MPAWARHHGPTGPEPKLDRTKGPSAKPALTLDRAPLLSRTRSALVHVGMKVYLEFAQLPGSSGI